MTSPQKLKRRRSSTLNIDDTDFDWLKGYLMREHSKQSMTTALLDECLAEDSLGDVALPQLLAPLETALPADAEVDISSAVERRSDASDAGPPPKLNWSASLVLDEHEHEHEHEEDAGGDHDSKRRRKIGWTNTEDLAILASVRRIGTQWPRIAAQLPGRTADAVRNRWHRLQKVHALGDSEEGRSAIDSLLVASGVDPDWMPPLIEAEAPGETAPTPEETCIRGSDHGRSMWTAEEDKVIEDGVAKFGCKWRQIAALLPGRSDSSVRNRWMRLCKDKQAGRETAVAPPVAKADTQPPPAAIRRAETMMAVEQLDASLAAAVEQLDVDELPLGLEAPDQLVDLESFVDAVQGVLRGDSRDALDLINGEGVYQTEPTDDIDMPLEMPALLRKASSSARIAAGMVAAAGVALAVGVARSRR